MAPKRKRPLKELSLPNISASDNELVEFPFNWNLKPTVYDQQKKCSVSNLTINAEWSLVCLWANNLIIPQFLEICRNSTAKEVIVSGTFKLWRDSECALQRKFIQLIEAGFECATTQIEFKYSTTSISCSYNSNYSITGTLTIPAGHTNYSKGVQFESLLNLSSDFECLLDLKASYFSDVSLKCGTVSLSAHKNILSARSPVFAAMFATQMKESRLHKVDITDISPHVLKAILTYLYTGKIGDISAQSVGELLYAADKYELLDLKRLCRDYLQTCVSAQNILNTLVLGYLHDQDLQGFAMDYICNTCEEFEILEKTAEWEALREKLDDLDKKHYAPQQKKTDVKAQETMSNLDKKGGNFSDFDNSDEDIASLLADDDDDIFAKKAFGDSPSKKASLGHIFSSENPEDLPKSASKITRGLSSKSSPKHSLSKSSSKLSDDGTDDDALNAFLSESSLPSFLADSKKSSPVKRNSKKSSDETEGTSNFFADLDKPSNTVLSQNITSKNIKAKPSVSDDEDDILKSLDSDHKASGTPRKQRSGSFFDDFLKTLSPKSSPKKSAAEQLDDIKGDDSEDDDDLLKSLESDVKAPASPRKRSGSFFDDFLKNISPKQSPKKASVRNSKSTKINTSKSQDSEEEEDILGTFSSPKKSFSPVRRNPTQEKRRESLQKQVSFKGIPESSGEQSLKESPIKEQPSFTPKIQPEKVASEVKMTSKPASQPKRSERMGAANKDDTDWLNFFKESPKKSMKPKEPPPKSKENMTDEIQLPSKDLKSNINRRRSSSAEWLGLSESAMVSKSLSQISGKNKIPLETDDDWLEEKEPVKISRPHTTPGKRKVGDDSLTADMSWIADDQNIAIEKSKNLPDSSNLFRDSASLSEASVPSMNKKNVITEAQNFEPSVLPQESRVASTHSQFEKEMNLQSPMSSGNRRDKYSASDLQNSVKNTTDSYAHRTVSKDSGFSQASGFDASANSQVLQTVINNHIFERDQLLKSSEAMKVMYEERIKTLENLYKDQFKALEDSLKNMEVKVKTEMEEKVRIIEEKLNKAAEEKRSLEKNFKTKQEESEKENLKEIQKLKELHGQSVALMKQDHDEALLRLKRLKEQEIEALLSTQAHSRSLQHLTEQLEARTTEMASLQVKLEERNQVTMRERQALLDTKEKDLRSLQNRLQKQLDNSDEERDRLQQLVLKLESRLQKYATEGEEERWDLQQMKARLSVQQKHLDEEYKLQVHQVEREKEKIRLSQDSLLHEQKTVLVQLAQERQQLMQEKADMEFLAKKIKEDDAKLHVKILKEETFLDRQKQVIQQEQSKLNFEKSNIKQELELLERERDALQSEKQMINSERMKLNELSFKLRRKENELEMLSTSIAEEKERGQAEHTVALRIKGDQQSREQQITKKMQELMEKEHQILSVKEKLAEERLELEKKKNSVLCNKCRLSLGHPINAPPIGIDHTSLSNVNTTPAVTQSLLNGISNPLVPPHLDPSLVVWYITAQKDREFLQEELSFLRSLKESSKKEYSKLNFSKK